MFLNNLLFVINLVDVYNVKNSMIIIVEIMCKFELGVLKCLVKNLGIVSELFVILV